MRRGASSLSSEKFWEMIDLHQYQQALCVLEVQKGTSVPSVYLNN